MEHYTTQNPYEKAFGYSRSTKRGPFIFVSGTTAIDPTTGILGANSSAYEQATAAFRNILEAVEALGGTKRDIARVRIFVALQEDTDGVSKALKEFCASVPPGPAATMIVGASFVDEMMKVEIEADAVVM